MITSILAGAFTRTLFGVLAGVVKAALTGALTGVFARVSPEVLAKGLTAILARILKLHWCTLRCSHIHPANGSQESTCRSTHRGRRTRTNK